MKALLRAVPDLMRLILRLAADPMLPGSVKVALLAAAVYLVSPFDLLPDFIPFIGYLDDVLVAAIVLDGILNHVDRTLVWKYWPGSAESFETLARATHHFARWVPRRFKVRIFAPPAA